MRGGLIALVLVAAPAAARADVMEVSPEGARWITGAVLPDRPVATAQISPVVLTAGPAPWQGAVAVAAARNGLSPALLEAVIWQESHWREHRTSPAGARGLAQLMPGTARQLGVDPEDGEASIEACARYLRANLDLFRGDLTLALAAYNAGPGRVIAARGVPPIRETRDYVAGILARLAGPLGGAK